MNNATQWLKDHPGEAHMIGYSLLVVGVVLILFNQQIQHYIKDRLISDVESFLANERSQFNG